MYSKKEKTKDENNITEKKRKKIKQSHAPIPQRNSKSTLESTISETQKCQINNYVPIPKANEATTL